jgi:hypothetical protein
MIGVGDGLQAAATDLAADGVVTPTRYSTRRQDRFQGTGFSKATRSAPSAGFRAW